MRIELKASNEASLLREFEGREIMDVVVFCMKRTDIVAAFFAEGYKDSAGCRK